MLLVFKRFSEYITLNINREKKTLKITGDETNYTEQEQPWRMLWDKCENHKRKPKENNLECEACDKVATKQDNETESLSDKKFVKVFDSQMKLYGFKLKKWES